MKSMILAAGYATRLYPLTENFPKPLLPVGGKTILDRLLEDIDSLTEITGHVIVSNHRFIGYFEDWKKRRVFRKPIFLLDDGTQDNEHRLGAVKDMKLAVESVGQRDDWLVLAGDNVLDFSLEGFVQYAAQKGTSCVMCHEEREIKKRQKTAVITRDQEGKITSYEEKPQEPKGNLAVPPFYCYRNEDISRVDEAMGSGCRTDAPGSFAAWLSSQTAMYAWLMPGKRYDIGDRKSYDDVRRMFGDGREEV